jgi:hypothetical protein
MGALASRVNAFMVPSEKVPSVPARRPYEETR